MYRVHSSEKTCALGQQTQLSLTSTVHYLGSPSLGLLSSELMYFGKMIFTSPSCVMGSLMASVRARFPPPLLVLVIASTRMRQNK